jgi:hypothetical protein
MSTQVTQLMTFIENKKYTALNTQHRHNVKLQSWILLPTLYVSCMRGKYGEKSKHAGGVLRLAPKTNSQ